MKATITILITTALLCGCKPSASVPLSANKWEYKVVTVKNFEYYMQEEAYKNGTDLDKIRNAKSGAGDFQLVVTGPSWKGSDYGVDLNALGQEGWELVSAVPQAETVPDAETGERWDPNKASFSSYRSFNNVRTGKVILIFKRPVK